MREIVCRFEGRSMPDALLHQEPSLPWACVVLDAKESVYKVWCPFGEGLAGRR
ncbi:hypothetical protein LG293_09695 [Citricoccus nitrophenolicus]